MVMVKQRENSQFFLQNFEQWEQKINLLSHITIISLISLAKTTSCLYLGIYIQLIIFLFMKKITTKRLIIRTFYSREINQIFKKKSRSHAYHRESFWRLCWYYATGSMLMLPEELESNLRSRAPLPAIHQKKTHARSRCVQYALFCKYIVRPTYYITT